MKIAIVHDKLVCKGGAEQVVLSFHNAFPDAPIYTLAYDADNTYPEFKACRVKTSWFGRIIKSEKNVKRLYFPLGVLAMQQLDVTGYDVVLQSATHCAKYVKTSPASLVITYCHNPFRLVWSTESYEVMLRTNGIKKFLYQQAIAILKHIDVFFANRTNWYITNSAEVRSRIKAAYAPQNEITVINPSVKCSNFYVSNTEGGYYLIVSRFESYKRVNLVINAFNQMPHKRLVVVGKGSREDELKGIAGPNITFLNGLKANELADIYANCKALVFPQLEDYGITPLEANAAGRPVIAYAKGGVLETMIPYTTNSLKCTAVFFDEQTEEALIKAVNLFETLLFDAAFIRSHAELFDEFAFVNKIKEFVTQKYGQKNTQADTRVAPADITTVAV
ncbi:glycosyltransferase [Mucilaginibacter phyllosphaerae]|uniref:Glycosyltransferase family 4 protein n=1 Tax=Mucilaginibacter phyllosphaerae TaxID=1812349 RepID=A0A4Y8AAW5_9SPHI|nr:glycosyltransferase [Mucilaginibacter phyllosphaerae]MBB3969688.1 glycosyltransferase involved in cell wall biosynthesis [Mucilaginibacter phyllosphaerae]TEW65072.1 glycosyltransferase family 4 protein [Mucilaginibacter phyllosphaerae]GGH18162.1 glycosyl transferase [Mucilaginibacter phyllosphaerae]